LTAKRSKHGLRDRRELGHYRFDELASLCAVVFAAAVVAATAAGILAGWPALAFLPAAARAGVLAAAAALAGCFFYGVLFEPRRLLVSRVEIASRKVKGKDLRLVHLSDLHVRWWSGLEEAVLRETRRLAPDLIVMSGDYTAVPCRIADAKRMLKALAAIAPVYASRGNGDYRRPSASELFDGTGAVLLSNARHDAVLHETPLTIAGVDPGEEAVVDEMGGAVPAGRLGIVLYHYPDLIPRLETVPFDLMLCGHTHGGQVRLPFWGAVVTLSRAGTRFAAGLFERGGRSAYVSRGIGTESHVMPPLRFLCPPELVLITLRGRAGTNGAA